MEATVIPVVAIMMPVVLVPIVLAMRFASRKREWEHLERMKSLELGVPVPGRECWLARTCIAIGAVVPIGALFLAWTASESGSHEQGYWEAATTVGGLGVLCGTFLATRLLASRNRLQQVARDAAPVKPAYDPDAYDVVGRRG